MQPAGAVAMKTFRDLCSFFPNAPGWSLEGEKKLAWAGLSPSCELYFALLFCFLRLLK